MTADVVIQLLAGEVRVAEGHELLAPTLVRSEVLSTLHEAVAAGELEAAEAKARLGRLHTLQIRLLGDGVMRKVAWEVADQLGWSATYAAEYVALTKLQGDALVTEDAELARAAVGIVATASAADLARP